MIAAPSEDVGVVFLEEVDEVGLGGVGIILELVQFACGAGMAIATAAR